MSDEDVFKYEEVDFFKEVDMVRVKAAIKDSIKEIYRGSDSNDSMNGIRSILYDHNLLEQTTAMFILYGVALGNIGCCITVGNIIKEIHQEMFEKFNPKGDEDESSKTKGS